MQTGEQGYIQWHDLPTPDQLWQQCHGNDSPLSKKLNTIPPSSKKTLRYYQNNAINAVLGAVAKGQNRILLTLATGTGKTTIASEIAYKLHQSQWNIGGHKRDPRILFLADRNLLADQAFLEFSTFDDNAKKRIRTASIRKGGFPKNGAVFFTIFQTFAVGDDTETENNTPQITYNFENYEPDFFDLIIIDECHRGGANDESQWRQILEYFAPAVQLGLTATPKRDANGDTYDYFGKSVYTYSLKQGIQDGFLTPYKLTQIHGGMDEYTHTDDNTILDGEIEIGETVSSAKLATSVLVKELVEKQIAHFLSDINPNHKTIVFCGTQERAGIVRDLINKMHPTPNSAYCARVTANDGIDGETHLNNFKDSDKTHPIILTTSQKLSTGVDVRDLRNIVIMRPVNSMIEFKQIVGRGTRTYDEKGFFTIYDFYNAHEQFQDPEWDGEPLPPENTNSPKPTQEPPKSTPEPTPNVDQITPDTASPTVVITLSGANARQLKLYQNISYMNPNGNLETTQEILNRLYDSVNTLCPTEQDLRQKWQDPDQRQKFLDALHQQNFSDDVMNDIVLSLQKQKVDIFDVLAHIAYETEMRTRHQRATDCHDMIKSENSEPMQDFLYFILEKYKEEGHNALSMPNLTEVIKLRLGSMADLTNKTGYGLQEIKEKLIQCQQHIYSN